MLKVLYPQFGVEVYKETLENGLKVFLIPKPGFQQVFASFTTNYGSVDRDFRANRDEDVVSVPDGIAHFLEHKMFEEEDGDVFNEFAKHGASANAFTTFDSTTYLFSATDDIEENTSILLDFVQRPYFTTENVEKEKGIIGQEIRMYDDNPEWRGFFELLRALYEKHPVRIEIAGTVESISQITKDTLYKCYQTFYHPSNMVFVVAGGFDPETIMTRIRENQAKKEFPKAPDIERPLTTEPAHAYKSEVRTYLGVSQPRCLIGYKDVETGLTGRDLLHRELLTGIILDVLFGRSSIFFDRLTTEELIDSSFGWEYEVTTAYGYSMIGGNTKDPERLVSELDTAVQEVVVNGLDEADFERSRKKVIGRFLTGLDQATHIARSLVSYELRGANWFETVDIVESFTLEEANARLREHFRLPQRAVSLVLPKDRQFSN